VSAIKATSEKRLELLDFPHGYSMQVLLMTRVDAENGHTFPTQRSDDPECVDPADIVHELAVVVDDLGWDVKLFNMKGPPGFLVVVVTRNETTREEWIFVDALESTAGKTYPTSELLTRRALDPSAARLIAAVGYDRLAVSGGPEERQTVSGLRLENMLGDIDEKGVQLVSEESLLSAERSALFLLAPDAVDPLQAKRNDQQAYEDARAPIHVDRDYCCGL